MHSCMRPACGCIQDADSWASCLPVNADWAVARLDHAAPCCLSLVILEDKQGLPGHDVELVKALSLKRI